MGCTQILTRSVHGFKKGVYSVFRVLGVDLAGKFAVHPLENGYNTRTVQKLLDHANLQMPMICTHTAQRNKAG